MAGTTAVLGHFAVLPLIYFTTEATYNVSYIDKKTNNKAI